MNIKDYVKFDERSEKIIDQKYNRKIELLNEKFNGMPEGIVYFDKRQTILDKKSELIDRLKKSNCPVRDESLLVEMAIAWAEANEYTSFTRAMREVMNEVAEDGKTFDGNLLEDDKHADITLEEAKEIFKSSNSNISDTIFNESLKLYRRSLRSWDESNYDNIFDICDYRCSVTIDSKEHEIPVMIIKQIIASATRMDFSKDTEKFVKEMRAIKIPDMHLRWPKE
jgi:hypothetical protein